MKQNCVMRDILKHQRQAFSREGAVTAATRIDRLTRLYRMIGENRDTHGLQLNTNLLKGKK